MRVSFSLLCRLVGLVLAMCAANAPVLFGQEKANADQALLGEWTRETPELLITLSPDGKFSTKGYTGSWRKFDEKTGEIRIYHGTESLEMLILSPDGQKLVGKNSQGANVQYAKGDR